MTILVNRRFAPKSTLSHCGDAERADLHELSMSLSSAMSPVWFGPWLELTSQRTFCAVLAPMMK
jgi:hypothetical protein